MRPESPVRLRVERPRSADPERVGRLPHWRDVRAHLDRSDRGFGYVRATLGDGHACREQGGAGVSVKPRYERPVLVRHAMGGMNKYGAQPPLRVRDRFDGVPIASLVERYGS